MFWSRQDPMNTTFFVVSAELFKLALFVG